ncbi:MAG TPA: LuxR C-terminal-related transcriptional regulator [Opitutaceae bacterium]|nr:LuxR C-terminal-related transcriptional regulator [Opitutaceae bacterium]
MPRTRSTSTKLGATSGAGAKASKKASPTGTGIEAHDRRPHLDDPSLRRAVVDMQVAASVPELWKALHRLLQQAIPNHHSTTLFLDAMERNPGALTLHSHPSRRPAEWWRIRSKLSPTHSWLDAHPGVKLYSLDDVVPDRTSLKNSDFYQHVLVPEGWDKLLGLTLWEQGLRKSILCLRRAMNQPAFSEADKALMMELHPVLDRNLRRIEKHEEEVVARNSLQQFINLLPQGVLLINARHELVFANHEAFDACAIWNHGVNAARQLNGRAVFAVPPAFLEVYLELMELHYKRALADPNAYHAPERRRLVHPTLKHMQADLSLFSLDDPLLSRPNLFAQIVNRESLDTTAPAAMDRQLTVLTRLTQREREVALLVREGLSNDEIARRLSKGVGTVKNQLQSIFAKLEIASRAKLISMLR